MKRSLLVLGFVLVAAGPLLAGDTPGSTPQQQQTPPAQQPTSDKLPANTPTADPPQSQTPPAQTPPSQTQPAQTPPSDTSANKPANTGGTPPTGSGSQKPSDTAANKPANQGDSRAMEKFGGFLGNLAGSAANAYVGHLQREAANTPRTDLTRYDGRQNRPVDTQKFQGIDSVRGNSTIDLSQKQYDPFTVNEFNQAANQHAQLAGSIVQQNQLNQAAITAQLNADRESAAAITNAVGSVVGGVVGASSLGGYLKGGIGQMFSGVFSGFGGGGGKEGAQGTAQEPTRGGTGTPVKDQAPGTGQQQQAQTPPAQQQTPPAQQQTPPAQQQTPAAQPQQQAAAPAQTQSQSQSQEAPVQMQRSAPKTDPLKRADAGDAIRNEQNRQRQLQGLPPIAEQLTAKRAPRTPTVNETTGGGQ